jgi:colicin import membrane protein
MTGRAKGRYAPLAAAAACLLGATSAVAQTAPPDLPPPSSGSELMKKEVSGDERAAKEKAAAAMKAKLEAKKQFDARKLEGLLNSPSGPSAAPYDLLDKSPKKTAPGAPGSATDAQTANRLVAAMRQFLAACWSATPDAPPVSVMWALNRDGTLMGVPKAVPSQYTTPQTKAAEQAAVKAVQTCAPFKLPPESYDLWREITWSFAPPRPQ